MDAATQPPPSRRLAWSLAVGLAVGVASGALARRCGGSDADERFGQRTLQHRPVVAIEAEAIVRDLAEAAASHPFDPPVQLAGTNEVGPASASASLAANAPRRPPAGAAGPSGPAAGRASATGHRGRSPGGADHAAGAQAAADADAEWAAHFGNSGFTRVALAGGDGAGKDAPGSGPAASAAGTRLAARLSTEVASSPKGAPVVALLQRPVRIGAVRAPRGSELFGSTSGQSAGRGRVTLDFTTVRLPNGDTLPIQGVAVDLQGRMGVAGKTVRGVSAAESIGSSAASRAARVFGLGLAQRVGGALGAGVAGASDAASSEVQASRDAPETVVVVARGTAFQVVLKDARR